MYWTDTEEDEPTIDLEQVVDLGFRIQCQALPVDHAWMLSQAILNHLPWLQDEPQAALHQIHVATSGNGWTAPNDGTGLLYPSRRTRLTLRLPKHRIDEATTTLNNIKLQLEPFKLTLSKPETQPLSKITTLYARHVLCETEKSGEEEAENTFLQRIHHQLANTGIAANKMVCGKIREITTPEKTLQTRSLMLTDLTLSEAVILQQNGLGDGKEIGCGIFIPHKKVENRLKKEESEG